jgi:quinolinate synthase
MEVEILAHFYQRPEVKALADFVGGSPGLYRAAIESRAKALMICGVEFLAQSLERLRPDLEILVPRQDAECPFSRTVGLDEVAQARLDLPDHLMAADLKASGAVRDLCDLEILGPGDWPRGDDRRPVCVLPALSTGDPAKWPHSGWPGAVCQVHRQVTAAEVGGALWALPGAKLAANSLCLPEVRRMADFVGDSQSIFDYCREAPGEDFLIVCENGLVESLRLSFPDKRFHETDLEIFCPNMKLTNIKDMLACLEARGPSLVIPDRPAVPAVAGS